MNIEATAPAESVADRLVIEVQWADWNGTLPKTSSVDILAPAIEAELNAHIAAGDYPEDTRFEGMVHGGVLGTFHHPIIEISVPNLETLFDFYTAYCGGDAGQAIDELETGYGYGVPVGWTPKR